MIDSSNNKPITIAQQEIIDAQLLTSGFSCVLQLPTGSGKTWLAEQAIIDVLRKSKRAIYLTPLKSIADEIGTKWQSTLMPKRVGVFTSDYTQSSARAYCNSDLLVMTPEKLDSCTRQWRSHWRWIPDIDLIVVDELHLLGEIHRGARLEGTLLRMLRLNPFIRILGLSATLGNRCELADWLNGVEYYSSVRSVPLEWKIVRFKKWQDKPNLLLREINRNLTNGGQTLVFVQSRKRCESLTSWLQEQPRIQAKFHHAGLSHEDRKLIENQFRNNELDVLVATSTLEMGVNLPARQVILYDMQCFNGFEFVPLPVNNVWQRGGRAGRPGLDSIGEIVLLAAQWDGEVKDYAKGKFEPIVSALRNPNALAEQIVTEIASGYAKNCNQLERIFNHSLAKHQNRLPDIYEIVTQMVCAGMLEETQVQQLRATSLGFIAVRHFLNPKTVLHFRKILEDCHCLTFLDLLIITASTEDCKPLLLVDFEDIETLERDIKSEFSYLLELPLNQIVELLGINGKRLLSAIATAIVIRDWTRIGDKTQVAQKRNCYPFEIEQLQESIDRLLKSMLDISNVLLSSKVQSNLDCDFKNNYGNYEITLQERMQVLITMINAGIDEEAATLTILSGISAIRAKQIKGLGITNIEELALCEISELATLPKVSANRAAKWIEEASDIVGNKYSAYRYLEEDIYPKLDNEFGFAFDIDPYRLRRALDLKVESQGKNQYLVTGGLDPHIVILNENGKAKCDCKDFNKGNLCKHILGVKLSLEDPQLKQLSDLANDLHNDTAINLKKLWMSK